MINLCPECQAPTSCYQVEEWTEIICWNCGHYESNSPAYLNNPQIFKDIVRKNPQHFLRKFLKLKSTDEFLHRKKADGDLTEPRKILYVTC